MVHLVRFTRSSTDETTTTTTTTDGSVDRAIHSSAFSRWLIVGELIRRAHVPGFAETSKRYAAVGPNLDASDGAVVQTDAKPSVRWKLKRAEYAVANDVAVTDDDFVFLRPGCGCG